MDFLENLPDFKREPFRMILRHPVLPSANVTVEFFPAEVLSVELPKHSPNDIKAPIAELAAKDLVTAMINHLKDISAWDIVRAIFLQKEVMPDRPRILIHVVAYEMKGFDVQYSLALKDIKGLLFIWLYGGLLTWEHLR